MLTKLSIGCSFVRGFVNGKTGKRLPRWALRAVQSYRFKKFQRKVLVKSPYYKSFATASLPEIPIINKAIHMENFNQINTGSLDRDSLLDVAIRAENSRDFSSSEGKYSAGLSSGTSGSRGLFVTTQQEQSEWAGFIIGRTLPFTLKKQRVALFLRANNNLYEKSNGRLIQFRFFDLFQGVDANIKDLEEFDPHILVAPASVLLRLMKESSRISPKNIISVAEVIEKTEKQLLQRYFEVPIEEIYQCTEGFLASTCRLGQLHLNEDVLLIEKHWIDKPSGRFNPIITDLRRKTQPIVRYHLDDILHLADRPCSCGNTTTTLKEIEGRMDDVIVMRNKDGKSVDIFPDFIRNTIISACPTITDYQVIQYASDQLEIKVQPMNSSICEDMTKALEELWERYCVLPPSYIFSDVAAPAYAVKRRRIITRLGG